MQQYARNVIQICKKYDPNMQKNVAQICKKWDQNMQN